MNSLGIDQMLEYILLAVHGCFFLIGLPANILLIVAIAFTRNQGLQSYSIILLNIAVTDVIAIITDMLSMTRIVANAPWVIFIYQGACRLTNDSVCFWSHDVMVHLFFHSILLIAVSFWFRSAVLSGSVPSTLKLQSALLLALVPTLVLIKTFEFGLTLVNQQPAFDFLKGVHPDMNISEIKYGIIDTFNPGGAATTLWVCIHPVIAYAAIIYNRREVKRKLNKLASSMSSRTRKMHESLIKALTYHSILPSSLCVAVFFFLLQQFNIARHPFLESTVFMSTTIPSVFNPLLTIYFVGPYRRFFTRLFCCRTKQRPGQANVSSSAVATR